MIIAKMEINTYLCSSFNYNELKGREYGHWIRSGIINES